MRYLLTHRPTGLLVACFALGMLNLYRAQAEESGVLPAVTPEAAAAYERKMQREHAEHPTLAVGARMPSFKLKGVDGKLHTQDEYRASKVLVVMFISNHCPASQIYESRIKQLASDYGSRGVAFVAIAPNGPAAVSPRELNYSDVDDGLPGMVERARYRHFNFPYLYDGDTQSVAHQFGPKVTPHLFVFDQERKLRFEGRIDNHLRAAKATTHEARDAIEALLMGKEVTVSHTPVFGCSTKWLSSSAAREELDAWAAQPVALGTIGTADLAGLKKHSAGMLMINFWATWCGPCQAEYPKLLDTYLWYRSRGLDFISVSVDSPDNRDTVVRFLNAHHSAIRNLQVDTDDVYAVQAAFDKSWESGVPYTLVLGADGSEIYRHAGEVDILAMRRAILASLPDVGLFAGNAEYWRQ